MSQILKTVIFTACLLWLLIQATRAEDTLSGIKVHVDNGQELTDSITNIIPFKVGDRYNKTLLDSFMASLKGLNLYKNIRYELKKTAPNQSRLEVHLTRAQKVRDVIVKGNYPLLDKDIKKLLPLQPGSLFEEGLTATSRVIIEEYLTKFGYYNSSVTIEKRDLKKKDFVDIIVTIKKGKTYRVGEILVTGHQVVKPQRIKNKFKHLNHFKMIRLKRDLKRVRNMYMRKGYVKARIKLETLEFDDNKNKVNLYLSIHENKKLTINIAGKTYLNKTHLKEITGLHEHRSYDSYAIKNGRKRLERYYKKRGFPAAAIKDDIIKKSSDEVIIKYTINPGKRIELKKIKFKGHKNISAAKLKKHIRRYDDENAFGRQFFDEGKLREDGKKLQQYYKKRGFLEVQIPEPEITTNKMGDQKIVTFTISEGPLYDYAGITILPENSPLRDQLRKKISSRIGKHHNEEKINKTRLKLIDHLNEQGYPYAEVRPEIEPHPETDTVKLLFHVDAGPKTVIRSILIDGLMDTRKKTILKNLNVKEGEPFIYKDILDSQLNLRKLGVFSSVRIIPLGFETKSKEIDLLVSVVERKPYIANIQGGFDSRHQLTGEINFTKLNIFGSGHQFSFRAIGGTKYNRGETTLFFPRIFGASWNLINQYFIQYEDEPNFTATSYGGFFSTLKNFGPLWTIGFKEQITRTDLYEGKSNVAALGNSLFDNSFSEFQFSVTYDRRDNFSDPQRGIYFLGRNEVNTDLSDARNNFFTYELNASHYYGFFKRFTFVNTLRFGHTVKITSNPRIPANKLFFMGGADTIRGFTEDGINPSGGTAMMIYNGELQFRISNSIKIAGFTDIGVLSNNLNQINIGSFRESAGAGLRYFTPIGPIRLDWGHILDRQGAEPKYRIHFSFGYFF